MYKTTHACSMTIDAALFIHFMLFFEQDRHRTVIYQGDFHIRPENPFLHDYAGFLSQPFAKIIVQLLCSIRRLRAGKAGTVLIHDSPLDRLCEDYRARGIDAVRETERLEGDLARQRKQAEERRVSLPGGGNLVIDRCEAMTVIDVNTAAAHGGGDKEATVLETNLEACEAAAEQIRLRDLGGIIIIDFIDLDAPEDRDRVAKRLEECFDRDRVKTVLHGWTSLGLMEMTRKRR